MNITFCTVTKLSTNGGTSNCPSTLLA
uniref:Uncharacterized protein n=1 Tax=Anguilla anguilla TaxID=7936 RepID=A0A0E9XCX3_ANGAN